MLVPLLSSSVVIDEIREFLCLLCSSFALLVFLSPFGLCCCFILDRRTPMASMSRREMLQYVGARIGGAVTVPVTTRAQTRTQGLAAVSEALISLSPGEAGTLRAMIARIIPADENGPGALEARADRFIDRALAGALKNQRAAYTTGLAAVDAYAQSSKGSPFAKLSAADQDAILTDMQNN